MYRSKDVLIAAVANGSYRQRSERNILVPEWLSGSHDRAMTEE